MDKKKSWIFPFILCLLVAIFTFNWNKISAETPEVSVSGKFVDTIQNIKVSNNEGGVLDWDLQQWATFRINADYDLSGKNVKAGDSTVVTVPDALMITNTSFQILDINTKEVIANAEVSPDNKSITITYTDYVEKHSDTSGSFFFYARIDFKKHPQKGEVPVEITINKETKVAGKVSFTGIGDGNPRLLTKTSWVNAGDQREVQYTISVNRTKQNIKNATLEDHLQFTNASYEKDSIKIIKGKFSYDTGEWVFSDRVDVTDQHKITISEDGRSFVIDLGDVTENDQYRIAYNVRLNYDPADGEVLKNEATLKGLGIETKNVTNAAAVQIAGGAGVGYVYSINIHKVDDANQPLKGAKFRVVRQANNQVIGEFESDENGNIAVGKLLKDKYILTEIEAPSGHIIKEADTVVNVEDFGTDHSVKSLQLQPLQLQLKSLQLLQQQLQLKNLRLLQPLQAKQQQLRLQLKNRLQLQPKSRLQLRPQPKKIQPLQPLQVKQLQLQQLLQVKNRLHLQRLLQHQLRHLQQLKVPATAKVKVVRKFSQVQVKSQLLDSLS